MNIRKALLRAAVLALPVAAMAAFAAEGVKQWHVHDMERPRPPVVTPGTPSTQDQVGTAPSDAIVIFDGKNMDAFKDNPTWKIVDGDLEVGKQYITTKQEFGDIQLHLEWREPTPPKGSSQGRGNSGVFLMGIYETQVLDSYQNDTYPDGQCGAVYNQHPPMVNACRPPGQWQTYDIVWHCPKFNADGSLAKPARITTLQNGVLIQDNYELKGNTGHMQVAKYTSKATKGPLSLQDHGNPIRFRNIWIRPLAEEEPFEMIPPDPNQKH
jgi:hypothetical protein